MRLGNWPAVFSHQGPKGGSSDKTEEVWFLETSCVGEKVFPPTVKLWGNMEAPAFGMPRNVPAWAAAAATVTLNKRLLSLHEVFAVVLVE